MRQTDFHPEAFAELRAAAGWYESQKHGLGRQFMAEVDAAVGMIQEAPRAWPVFFGNVRRCLLRQFPFGILYQEQLDGMVVLAVMHLRQRPRYWRDRLRR